MWGTVASVETIRGSDGRVIEKWGHINPKGEKAGPTDFFHTSVAAPKPDSKEYQDCLKLTEGEHVLYERKETPRGIHATHIEPIPALPASTAAPAPEKPQQ
jgi:hypothetical protein